MKRNYPTNIYGFLARKTHFRTLIEEVVMVSIRAIVQQTLATGYLTLSAQNQLRQLLQTTKYGQEDINAFMKLQQAAMDGRVKQEAHELMRT